MDYHLLILISCVFLVSLVFLLFINKFFKRKTFEEVVAEKKALTDKLYAQSKSSLKKPKKLQQKKDQKREKKQRQQKEHSQQQADNLNEKEDSDTQSEKASGQEKEAYQGLSKVHVEFEPDPVILTETADITVEKESANNQPKSKNKKDKKHNAKSGILLNKHETPFVKEKPIEEQQQQHSNHFDVKPPKDALELKKQEKEAKKEEKQQLKKERAGNKKDKPITNASTNDNAAASVVAEQPTPAAADLVESPLVASKELKPVEELKPLRQTSPKSQQVSQSNHHTNQTINKSKQVNKKQVKEQAATKELAGVLEKLSENDTIGVNLLMKLFSRADLNRSEIQILIDYLLNKQQDTPSTHAEWSDDICQKLKRQLEDKERALIEVQETSAGIQAKLRELRAEVNVERAQMSAKNKAYAEKLQLKEQEANNLAQELSSLNDKLVVERKQFQAQLLQEKQAGSQELAAQVQMLQTELAHKENCIKDLTCMVKASRQAVEESQQKSNEIIQQHVQQIRALEQQRDELERISNNRVYELEQLKTLENENAESKVEIRNLHNALESAKTDVQKSQKEVEALKSELATLRDIEQKKKIEEIQQLTAKNNQLTQQIAGLNSNSNESLKQLQSSIEALKVQLTEKEAQLAKSNVENVTLNSQLNAAHSRQQQQESVQSDLQKSVEFLKTEAADTQKKLLEASKNTEKFIRKEQNLLQELQEQKDKNNDLRVKNWKLIEALQNTERTARPDKQLTQADKNLVRQQQDLAAAAQKSLTTAKTTILSTGPQIDQKQLREIFQRLYPEAVKSCENNALSLPLAEWLEQVLTTHLKQHSKPATSESSTSTVNAGSSHKSTQSSASSAGSSGDTLNHNSHGHANTNSNGNANSKSTNAAETSTIDNGMEEMQHLRTENAQLRERVDELTTLAKKTGNTLSELEIRAREQDEQWRNIVRSKDEQICSLQHSNGEQLQNI